MNTRPFTLFALLVAGILGFGLAKWTSRGESPPPANAQAVTAPSELEVEDSHLAAVGIELEAAEPGDLSAEIRAPGVVASVPDALAVVTAHVSGTLVNIEKRLGDSVQPGTVLAKVESRDAAAIAAERDVAISKAALARSNLKREQDLFDQHVTPRQDLENARVQLTAAESEERRATAAAANAHVASDGRSIEIVSPIAGRITAANARLGSFVQSDMELFRVADPVRIQVEVAVPPTDSSRIMPGDPAVVVPGLKAVVRSVTAAINEQTRSATVVLAMSDALSLPAPGSFVRVVITPKASNPQGIVVAEEAIQRVEGRDVVFVRTDKGFRVQPVAVAARAGGRAMVASGLASGEQIAARNAFFLKAELNKGAEEDEE